MKRVFSSHAEVCHVWAQQTQAEGRARDIIFDGKSIYSYGSHFELARFIDAHTVLVTTRRYSVSTTKQLSLVHRAVSHKQVFRVPSFTDHAENVRYYIDRAREYFDRARRARTAITYLLGAARHTIMILRDYLEQFPTPIPESHAEVWARLNAGTYLDSDAQSALREKERTVRNPELESQRLAREREEQERLAKWIVGELGSGRFSAMRLRVKENEVETTHGARVPVIEARKLYRALQAGIDVAGQQIGHYIVTRLDKEDIVIGCHKIPLAEIERIAPQVMN